MSSDSSDSTLKAESPPLLMEVAEPSAKSDDDTSSSASSDSDLWFEDGNIILESTDGAQFRVYRGVLVAGSVFFRDMFGALGCESTTHSGKIKDGCPVINLQEDKEDLSTLLEALYHPPEIQLLVDVNNEDITTILRMSRKYQFDRIRDRAVEILKGIYPSTLEAFDAMHNSELNPTFSPSKWWKCVLIKTINCVVEADIKAILPAAYLMACVRLSLKEIVEGLAETPSDDITVLCKEAQGSILRGYEALKGSAYGINHPWSFRGSTTIIPSKKCSNNAKCLDTRKRDTENAFILLAQPEERMVAIKNVIRRLPLDDLIDEKSKSKDNRRLYCAACLLALRIHTDECRAKVFAELPVYFGLGTWKTLLPDNSESASESD